MMKKIPGDLEQQAKETQAIHESIYGKKNSHGVTIPDVNVNTDTNIASDTIVADAAQTIANTSPDNNDTTDTAQVIAPITPPRPTRDNAEVVLERDEDNTTLTPTPTPQKEPFEHQYRTLQGKYNADIKKVREEKKTTEQEVKRLEKLIIDMQEMFADKSREVTTGAVVSTQTPTPTPVQTVSSDSSVQTQTITPSPRAKFLTDKDVSEYGQELIDFNIRCAKDAFTEFQDELISEINNTISNNFNNITSTLTNKISNIESTQVKSSQERFYESLDRDAQNWRTLNTDTGFNAWLQERQPLTQYKRNDFLQDAFQKLDVQTVAEFFNLYQIEHAGNGTVQSDIDASLDSTTSSDSADETDTTVVDQTQTPPLNPRPQPSISPNRTRGANNPAADLNLDTNKKKYSIRDLEALNEKARNHKVTLEEFNKQFAEITLGMRG